MSQEFPNFKVEIIPGNYYNYSGKTFLLWNKNNVLQINLNMNYKRKLQTVNCVWLIYKQTPGFNNQKHFIKAYFVILRKN